MCRSGGRSAFGVKEVHANTGSDAFLGAVETAAVETQNTPWVTTLTLNGRTLQFKIDTGADATVIPEADYREERDGPLSPSDQVLTGASQQPLSVRGRFSARLCREQANLVQDIYVISGLRKPLLG